MAAVGHDGGGLLHRGREEVNCPSSQAEKIVNTAQGSQFTSIDFIAELKKAEIAISMVGKAHGATMLPPSGPAVDEL